MLLKFIGASIIICASSLIGWTLSKKFSLRPQQIRELETLMQVLENEICYMSSLLQDALANTASKSKNVISVFFSETSKKMHSEKGQVPQKRGKRPYLKI